MVVMTALRMPPTLPTWIHIFFSSLLWAVSARLKPFVPTEAYNVDHYFVSVIITNIIKINYLPKVIKIKNLSNWHIMCLIFIIIIIIISRSRPANRAKSDWEPRATSVTLVNSCAQVHINKLKNFNVCVKTFGTQLRQVITKNLWDCIRWWQ
jgi:hypothetical protein